MSGSFYLKARKHGRSLNIPIEEKHQYKQLVASSSSALGAYQYGWLYKLNQSGGSSMTPHNEAFRILASANSDAFSVATGTGEEARIGQKIQLVNVDHYINICLDGASLSGTLSHGNMVDCEYKFRLMTVKFNQEMNDLRLANWWSAIHVYNGLYTGGSTAQPQKISSVWTDTLSESNNWTGTFKILYDEKFTLGKNHTATMKHIHLSPKMNLTFASNNVVNEDFLHTYTFIVMPLEYRMDMDCVSQDIMTREATPNSVRLILYNAETKYTYYDL